MTAGVSNPAGTSGCSPSDDFVGVQGNAVSDGLLNHADGLAASILGGESIKLTGGETHSP